LGLPERDRMRRQELVDAIAISIGKANSDLESEIMPEMYVEWMIQFRFEALSVVRIPCIAALIDEMEPS
jgi:hypothetical protein